MSLGRPGEKESNVAGAELQRRPGLQAQELSYRGPGAAPTLRMGEEKEDVREREVGGLGRQPREALEAKEGAIPSHRLSNACKKELRSMAGFGTWGEIFLLLI